MDRDWARARRAKHAYWQARITRGGLREVLQITTNLRTWMSARVPQWPTQREREEDFETHRRVSQALSATARTPAAKTSALRGRTRRVR
jgi:hypothetical protein